MKTGKFIIVNEPTEETIDRELKVPAENCDVFPAKVYIPKYEKKMEKGLLCVVSILAQIVIYVLMASFFKWGYALMIPIEVVFLALYGKEHVSVLRAQMFYLAVTLFFGTLITVISLLPDSYGTRNDIEFLLPTLDRSVMALYGVVLGMVTCTRILLVASYHTHLFYSNLREKFMDGKVCLQPS